MGYTGTICLTLAVVLGIIAVVFIVKVINNR